MEATWHESPTSAGIRRSSSPPRRDRGVSAMGMLYITIIASCLFHHEPMILIDVLTIFDETPFRRWWSAKLTSNLFWHSHNHTTLSSTIASLFTHADWGHLFSNMFLLWMTGKYLFVPEDTRAQHEPRRSRLSWTSPLAFVWFYLGSECLSIVGCRLIGRWLDHQWSSQQIRERELWSWEWIPYSWRDAWFTLSHVDHIVDLRAWQYTPSIGSSAAIFGIVGAHIYTALFCNRHPARMTLQTKAIWLGKIGMELAKTPFSLEQLSSLSKDDNIDHAAHICGFLGGFLLAILWDYAGMVGLREHSVNHRNSCIMEDL